MWRWASWAILVSLCSGFCLLAAGSRAQIYEWTDDHGRVHLTDDLSQVPPGQRSEAEREVNGSGSKHGWNHVPLYPQGTRATASPTSLAPEPASEGRKHVLGIQRAGNEIRILATLNGSVAWPYVVDTGATLNTIPRAAVDRLGIMIDEDTPTTIEKRRTREKSCTRG